MELSPSECAEMLRSMIFRREHKFQNLYLENQCGDLVKIPPEKDLTLAALKFALSCVEEKTQK